MAPLHRIIVASDSFKGSLPAFFAAFTSGKKLSQKEIDELQEMINDLRGKS